MARKDRLPELLAVLPTTYPAIQGFHWDTGLKTWWIESSDDRYMQRLGSLDETPWSSDDLPRILEIRAGHRWARVTMLKGVPGAMIEARANTLDGATTFAVTLADHLGAATGLAWTILDQSPVDKEATGMRYQSRARTHPRATSDLSSRT